MPEKRPLPPTERRRRAAGFLAAALPPCALAAVVVASHWEAIHFGRIYMEDFSRLFAASAGRGWLSWTQLFSPEYFTVFSPVFFYRPLTTAHYHACWLLFGTHISAYQWVKAAAVFGSSLLVYLTGTRIVGSRSWALAGALLYAASPAYSLLMTGLSFVDDIFMTFLLLAAFWGHTRVRDPGPLRPFWPLWIASCYLLALLSKEAAITFPFLPPLYDLAFRRGRSPAGWLKRNFWEVYLPLFLITAAYAAALGWLRSDVYGTVTLSLETPLWLPALRLLTYAARLFLPVPDAAPGTLFLLGALSGLAALLAWEARAESSLRAWFFGAWIVLGLLPVINLVSSGAMPGYLANPIPPERHLTFSGVAFFWLAAAALRRGAAGKRFAAPLWTGAALLLLLSAAQCRSYESRAKGTFLSALEDIDRLRPGPDGVNSRFNSLLVSLPFLRREEPATFLEVERTVRGRVPGYAGPTLVDVFADDAIFDDPRGYSAVIQALADRGFTAFQRDLREAARHAARAEAPRLFARGIIDGVRLCDEGVRLFRQGDPAQAALSFRGSLEADPKNVFALMSLAAVLSQKGEAAAAIRLYDRVIALTRNRPDLRAEALRSRLLETDRSARR